MEKSNFLDLGALFTDGGYLNKVIERFDKPKIDYLKLSDNIFKLLKLRRLRTYYYNCLPFVRKDNFEDVKRKDKTQKFFDKLNRLSRFEVKLGELQMIKGIYKQKRIDVLMSLDIVDMCFDNQINNAVLIAGDEDFIPAIQKAKSCGKIIHLFCYRDAVNEKLLDAVDEIYYLDKEFFDNCLINKL